MGKKGWREEPKTSVGRRPWLARYLLISCFLQNPAWETAIAAPAPAAEPTVVVQIQFVPGGRRLWREAFESQIVPAIQAAIDSGELIDYEYFETITPSGNEYDFMFALKAKSFAFFDQRRLYPHWAALFQRVGVEEGRRILEEMQGWEKTVTVSLMRSYRGGK